MDLIEKTSDLHWQVAERLYTSKRACVLSGAGISRESGVPTFREADGLWNKFRPEELANVDAFLTNPERVWEWYQWRRDLIGGVEPNPGHYALAEIQQLHGHVTVITQNVDNLHQAGGCKDVVELHGNIMRNRCQSCGRVFQPGEPEAEISFKKGTLPRCSCAQKGMLRPDVVWFGEMLPEDELMHAVTETEECDLFLSIGTSTVVYPAASLPFQAHANGASVVEINPNPTDLTRFAEIVIAEPSGEALPKIAERLKQLVERGKN